MASTDRPRVLLVSADPLASVALRGLLTTAGADVVAEHPPAAFVPELLRFEEAELLVWDMGSDADVVPDVGSIPTVVLVADERSGRDARAHGHKAIVSRLAAPPILAHAMQGVLLGLAVVDPAFLRDAPAVRQLDPGLMPLSEREVGVLELVALGMSNKEIAAELGISESTVKFHLNAILEKLDAGTRTEAAVRATQLGWLQV